MVVSFIKIPPDLYILLVEKIIERVASRVDFCNHLIKVGTEFFYSDLLFCTDENARSVLLRNPRILELLQSVITACFRRQRELIVRLVGISVHLIKNNEYRLVYGVYIL